MIETFPFQWTKIFFDEFTFIPNVAFYRSQFSFKLLSKEILIMKTFILIKLSSASFA